jgi:hypothetical protein
MDNDHGITGELREWFEDRVFLGNGWQELHDIADRIDAEHEAKVSYWQSASYKDGYDEGFASADDWLGQHEDAMAEHGWIRLPLDANGEVVRIGDVMVMASHPFGCEDKPLVVDRMELSRGMHGEVWCLALDTDRSCWTQAAVLRHYHKPTVEDVLREMLDAWGELPSNMTNEAIIAEYAAKLRLAGDAETCRQEERGWTTEGDHARVFLTCGHDCMVETVADIPNFCPVCGARVEAAK